MSAAAPKKLVVLAAGRGTRLGAAAEGKPKAATLLHGEPLLHWQLTAARAAGFHDLTILRGYRPDRLPPLPAGTRTIDNPVFDRTNMVFTLYLSREQWGEGVAISYGDIVYEPSVIEAVWSAADASPSGVAVVVDRAWQAYWSKRFADPLVDAETLKLSSSGTLAEIGQRPRSLADVQGQYIGLTCFRGQGVKVLRDLLTEAAAAHQFGEKLIHPERAFPDLYMTDVLQHLITRGHALKPAFIDAHWLEIDTPSDLALAAQLSAPRTRESVTLLEIHR